MKASKLLRKYGWCQRHFAVDRSGRSIDPSDNRATAFCLDGALIRCYYRKDLSWLYYQRIKDKLQMSPAYWNDMRGRTKEEVVALLEAMDL